MAENLIISGETRAQRYEALLPQLHALVEVEKNLIANLANICSGLKMTFDFFWVGFYIVDQENNVDELVLGPFQGPIACTRIRKAKGVCGSSWSLEKTIIVADVANFPGHIACSSASQSEIVVPIIKNNKVVAVLDVDSDKLNDFDQNDQLFLEKLCQFIAQNCF